MIPVIAAATAREALRSRAFIGLLALFTVLMLLSRLVGWISSTDGHQVTAELVMSLQSVIGVLVAVATGTALVQQEITNKTLYTVLARPLPRWHFVLGKYLGLAAALAAGQAAMTALSLAYLALTGAEVQGWLLLGALLTLVEVLIMAAVGLCWTALSSPLLAAALSLATYALGHAVSSTPGLIHHISGWKQMLIIAAASLVPDLGHYTYRSDAVKGLPLPWGELGLALGYGALWIALLVTITIVVIRRKQL